MSTQTPCARAAEALSSAPTPTSAILSKRRRITGCLGPERGMTNPVSEHPRGGVNRAASRPLPIRGILRHGPSMPAKTATGELMPSSTEAFLALFDESRFVPELKSKTKADVLKELADAMASDPDVRHPQVILDALVAREKLGSTGIGKEVA